MSDSFAATSAPEVIWMAATLTTSIIHPAHPPPCRKEPVVPLPDRRHLPLLTSGGLATVVRTTSTSMGAVVAMT